ncbi:MAG TPA: hypothetical protein VNE59_03775 [Burkholderiales bacterium]|nr:hypothetical protein [Burkholderiales bacterium]
MTIRVESYAGYRDEQEPLAFWLGERRLAALEIADRWQGPGYRYFRVKADDGNLYILRHDEAQDTWQLEAFTRAPGGLPAAGGGSSRVSAPRGTDPA